MKIDYERWFNITISLMIGIIIIYLIFSTTLDMLYGYEEKNKRTNCYDKHDNLIVGVDCIDKSICSNNPHKFFGITEQCSKEKSK